MDVKRVELLIFTISYGKRQIRTDMHGFGDHADNRYLNLPEVPIW